MQDPIPLSDVFKYYTSPGKVLQATDANTATSVRENIRASEKIKSIVSPNPKNYELAFALDEELKPISTNFEFAKTDIEVVSEHPSLANFAIGIVVTDRTKGDIPQIKKDLVETSSRNLRRALVELTEKYTLKNIVGIMISDFSLEVKPMKAPTVEI